MMDVFLRDKRDDEQEYTLHLFTYCNLSCGFCWQDHDSLVGVDDVMGKLPAIERLLDREWKSSVVFNIMGGEVFAPEIFTEELMETYLAFSEAIVERAQARGIEVTLNWVSNMVLAAPERLERFLARSEAIDCAVTLTTSYDPRGRFNREQFATFKTMVERFGPEKIKTIALVLTKPNIRYFLKDQDAFFQWAYAQGFKIYFDYLMPDAKTNDVPSDHDLFAMFKFLIDRYPRCEPISGWQKQIEKKETETSNRT